MTNQEFIESIRLEGEEWRDVVGAEGLYMVSNLGRVASVFDTVTDRLRTRASKRIVLTPNRAIRNGKYYHTVRINRKTTYVHRLVAQAFLPNTNNYPEVDHINRDGLDNRIENLRWCSHAQNQNNKNTREAMSKSGKLKRAVWFHIPVVQLHDNALIKTYACISDVKKDGHLPAGVVHCLKGKTKTHHGFTWMYLSDYESLVSMSKNYLSNPDNNYPQ